MLGPATRTALAIVVDKLGAAGGGCHYLDWRLRRAGGKSE